VGSADFAPWHVDVGDGGARRVVALGVRRREVRRQEDEENRQHGDQLAQHEEGMSERECTKVRMS